MRDTEQAISPVDDAFAQVERQYLPVVLAEIRSEAEKRAKEQNRAEINYVDAFRAFEQRFGQMPSVERLSFWEAVFGKDNSFVIIMAIMTITFGILGLAPLLFTIDKGAYNNAAFLDIAKLFAGVIVGGAAGAAAGRRGKP